MREEILVIKFGGRSLGSPVRIRAAVARVRHHRSRGRGVVVVVSAAGATTDRILARFAEVEGREPASRFRLEAERERDRALATGEDRSASILAAGLLAAGIPARSLGGGEAGLLVRGTASDPEVDPTPVRTLLDMGVTPVVSGFQAARDDGETATLGRGGSDLTAVALAGALGPAACHLVKDVAGIFDRDPAGGPGAQLLDTLGHHELVALARDGARVIQAEAAQRALTDRVALRIYHFASHPGARGGSRVDPPDSLPHRHPTLSRTRERVV